MQELSNVIADKYEQVIEEIKKFSSEYLNDQYKNICIKAAETLFLKNEEQFKKGKSFSWAAGIVHAIGSINNLFDSNDEPYVKATDLYKAFGISSSTGSSKSKQIKNLLDLSKENKQWIVAEDKNGEYLKKDILKEKEEAAVTVDDIPKEKKESFKFAVHKNCVVAQRIINYAWKQKNYKNKEKYAKEALRIYEDCSDAYIILSKNSSLNNIQRKALLEKAVKAAQNVLRIDNLETADPQIFKLKIAKNFFGAKYCLAVHLWKNGEKEIAIENAFEILKYNEQDNLMIRNLLPNWLLIEEKYEQLESLLEKYERDNLAAINYSRVALLYKTNRIKEAENALRRAYKRNPFVIPYILKQKMLPSILPHSFKFGSEEEAIKYFSVGFEVWNDPNMIKWVKEKKSDFDIINFK
jgi:tetratricopeptide (TPR) repeat protein